MKAAFLLPETEAYRIFRHIDVDGDNFIQWSECLAATIGAKTLRMPEALTKLFHAFDQNKNGRIEFGELHRVFGDRVCGQPVEEIFKEADRNSDDTIDLDEFTQAVAPECSRSTHVMRNEYQPNIGRARS